MLVGQIRGTNKRDLGISSSSDALVESAGSAWGDLWFGV